MFKPGDFVRFKSYVLNGHVIPRSNAFMVVHFDDHAGCYILQNQFKEARHAVESILEAY